MTAPLRVAVLGAGTVGREVIRAFADRPDVLRAADGRPLSLAGVAVRNLPRAVAAGIPEAVLTDAPAHLVADPDVDVIVELMGGEEPARTLIGAALSAGKGVVSGNKHVLAHHGAELEALARRTGAALRFEAAVGGGTPVLGPLATDLATNRVIAIRGIVNGTTNAILTAMTETSQSYEAALLAAQQAGFAEADPSGDVEGWDAANKLVVLSRLAFGRWLDVAAVPRSAADAPARGQPGITGVTAADLVDAASRGQVVKLVAEARRDADRIEASVAPRFVDATSALGRTGGVTNLIEIEAEPLGRVTIAGPGAGGPATASAVLADLVALARGLGSTWAGLPPAGSGPA